MKSNRSITRQQWVQTRVSVQGVNHLAAILHVYAGGLKFMK